MSTVTEEERVYQQEQEDQHQNQQQQMLPSENINAQEQEAAEGAEEKETRENFERLEYHQRMMELGQRDVDLLQLAQQEMQEMISNNEYQHDEYFDLKYFAGEAEKCWSDRRNKDATMESPMRVRLFPKESSILEQKQIKEARELAQAPPLLVCTADGDAEQKRAHRNVVIDNAQFALRHPLIHRNLKRNAERRAVFEEAARDYKSFNGRVNSSSFSPSKGGEDSSASYDASALQMWKEQQALKVQEEQKAAATRAARVEAGLEAEEEAGEENEKEKKGPSGEEVAPAETAVEEQPKEGEEQQQQPTKRTLTELLKEQKLMMGKMIQQDQEVYQPMLQKYFEHDQMVFDKLDRLLNAATPPAAEGEEGVEEGEEAASSV